jgi:hypothetical protein
MICVGMERSVKQTALVSGKILLMQSALSGGKINKDIHFFGPDLYLVRLERRAR